MGSYVDDFFGGPKRSKSGVIADKRKANLLFKSLIAVGELTGAKMNLKKAVRQLGKWRFWGSLMILSENYADCPKRSRRNTYLELKTP